MIVIYIIIGIVVTLLLWSNITVYRANRWFYNELIKKGYDPQQSRRIMDNENLSYQMLVKAKIYKGPMLIHHLRSVIDEY